MKVIGLTGGIASGKSTIANLLRSLGAPVFDADAESRALVAKGRAALNEIALAFGIEYLTDGGELNRPKMAELVFHDKEALKNWKPSSIKTYWRQRRVFWRNAAVKICRRQCLMYRF